MGPSQVGPRPARVMGLLALGQRLTWSSRLGWSWSGREGWTQTGSQQRGQGSGSNNISTTSTLRFVSLIYVSTQLKKQPYFNCRILWCLSSFSIFLVCFMYWSLHSCAGEFDTKQNQMKKEDWASGSAEANSNNAQSPLFRAHPNKLLPMKQVEQNNIKITPNKRWYWLFYQNHSI